jgi:predicted ATPase
MIKSLKVNKLNQQMSFDLKFHDDINIITGKNGSGKTTLLKLLWYAISGNLERIIQEISFESFELETDSVRIEMKFITAKPGNAVKIDCTTQEWGFSTLWFESESEPQYARTRQIAEATGSSVFFPTFRRIEGGFSTYAHHHADVVANPNQTPNSYFVQLNRGRPTELQKAMLQLSERLSVSEHRFVASISTDDLSTLLNSKYAEISEKARRIQNGFSDYILKNVGGENGHAQEMLAEIKKRATDVTQANDALLRPFTVLSELVSEILQYKGIKISGPVTLGEAQEAILSDRLSSGEKQMLSFLCYNAFANKSCIFIDEPEISLHVDWQRILFPTLLSQSTGNQFIVATHSPFIYSKYADKELVLADRGDADADTPDDGRGDPQHPSKDQLAYAPGGG